MYCCGQDIFFCSIALFSEMGFDCDEAIFFGLLEKVLNVFSTVNMAIHTAQK